MYWPSIRNIRRSWYTVITDRPGQPQAPAQSWKEARSLLAALDRAKDKVAARTRLKAALKRIVAGIWLLVVPRGRTRLCEVLLTFHDACAKAYRGATIFYRATTNNRWGHRQPARWAVVSWAQPKGCRPGWPVPADPDGPYPQAEDEAYGTDPLQTQSLDLREPDQASQARELLEGYPLYIIDRILAEGEDVP
jgi:hypothetical protein